MKTFYRNIIFSDHELIKGLRYKDIFQIKPMRFENAPNSEHIKYYPLLIEYWIDGDEIPNTTELPDSLLKLSLQTEKVHGLLDLLTAITNYNFFWYSLDGFNWFIPVPEDITKINNEDSSSVGMGLYYYPQMSKDLLIDGFSEHDYMDITLANDYYYFTHFDSFKYIAFPVSYEKFLDNYFNLDPQTKSKIDSVLKLIKHGVETLPKYKSLSFISFISAIETLVNEEYRDENKKIEYSCDKCKAIKDSPFKCEDCGNPTWAIGFKFKEFLKKHVSSSTGSVTKYNKIYNLRSKIVHSGNLLLGDNNLTIWEHPDKSEKEYVTHLETMQLSRLSLFNWILKI